MFTLNGHFLKLDTFAFSQLRSYLNTAFVFSFTLFVLLWLNYNYHSIYIL